MTLLYSVLAVALALPIQWLLSSFNNFWLPPVLMVTVIFSFWHLKMYQRFWLGLILGLALDSVSIFPFGTHLVIFSLAAAMTGTGRFIFSNTKSIFTQSLSAAIILFASIALLYPVGYVISYVSGMDLVWPYKGMYRILAYAAIWSVFMPLVASGIESLQKNKLRIK